MRSLRILGFFIIACYLPLSFAQSSITATSAATVGTPAKAAKPAVPPKTDPPTKYLVKVHSLSTSPVVPGGCSHAPLVFPATNADQVVKDLSEPDYKFVSFPPDRIAIYYKERKANPPNLAAVEADMDKLATADFQNAVAISVPHSSAAKTLKQLTLPADGSLTATAVDDSCILLVSKAATPDPVLMASLRKSLPQLYWRTESTQPTQRLFHIDATTVAKKLAPPAASDSSSSGDSSAADAAAPKSSGTGSSSKPSAPSSSKSSPAPGNTVAQNIAVSVASGGAPAEPASSPGTSDSSGDFGSAKNPSPTTDKTPADKTKTASTPPKPVTMQPVNDTLVCSNDDGSDRGFFERNRLMAVLDLPRPEVLMNIWSLQVSTRDPKTASLEAESAGELISHNNEGLENSIEQGWETLSEGDEVPRLL